MPWDLDSKRSIYGQIIERIKGRIVTGAYPPGEKLPSVRDLAQEAGVNPNTMQRALSELERTGVIYSQRTSGRFVTDDMRVIGHAKQRFAEEQIRSFLTAMEKLGYTRGEILTMLEEKETEHDNT